MPAAVRVFRPFPVFPLTDVPPFRRYLPVRIRRNGPGDVPLSLLRDGFPEPLFLLCLCPAHACRLRLENAHALEEVNRLLQALVNGHDAVLMLD